MPEKDEFCEECGEHEDGCECEEYCDECDNLMDDCECEEESSFLEDIKNLADTVKSVAEDGKSVKKLIKSSDHIDLNPDKFKQKRFEIPLPQEKPLDLEIMEHPDAKAARRHKQNLKLGIIGIIIASALGIIAIIFK